MKVLHVISSGGMYGAEAVILNLARGMRGGPHTSVLGVFRNSANPNVELHEAALADGFESYLIECSGQIDLKTPAAIRALVESTQVDVVHVHGYKADIYVRLALGNGNVPLVATCHGWCDTDFIVSLYTKLDRFVLRQFVRVVAVSGEVKRHLLDGGIRSERIRIVRNGIGLEPFARPLPLPSPPERDLVVGFIGRLSVEKGADIFVSAAAGVAAEFSNARFILFGDGPEREALGRQIDALGLRGRVELAGRCNDMPAAYASLDVMVSTSRQEGLPMALLEGMASALPIVATAVGEVSTLVRNDETGFLISTGDDKAVAERTAAAVLTLLGDAELRAKMGAAARQLIVDEYSASRMAADYVRVYDEAIEEVRRHG